MDSTFDSAIECLENGKLLIYPTETIYGMGVDAQNEEALKLLFKIKKRDPGKPVPILLPHKKELSKYCKKISPVAQTLIDAFWPGSLTIVMESDVFPKAVSKNGKVGFRVSSHPLVQNLLLRYNHCITTTSANLSNKEPPTDPMDFFSIFPKDSFLLIQEIKPSKPSKPSTVIDCTNDRYVMLRQGAISKNEIEAVLEAHHL